MVFPTAQKHVTASVMQISSPVSWSMIKKPIYDFKNRLSISPDFSSINLQVVNSLPTPASSAEQVYANTKLTHPVDTHYVFYTDDFLIHLGTPEVSMGRFQYIWILKPLFLA